MCRLYKTVKETPKEIQILQSSIFPFVKTGFDASYSEDENHGKAYHGIGNRLKNVSEICKQM